MKSICQQLNIKNFPFIIKDSNNNEIYYENSDGSWWKKEFDSNGNEIYYENSDGYWIKYEYDSESNMFYIENSDGFWIKREFDSNGNEIYFEDSYGIIEDNRSKEIVLTMNEIADKFDINVKNLKIKK